MIAGSDGPPALRPGGDALKLGIRPEHVRLARSGQPARLEATEYLGADSVLTCTVGRERLLVRAPGRVSLAAGSPVMLAWSAADLHLFDAASGRRRDDALATVIDRGEAAAAMAQGETR